MSDNLTDRGEPDRSLINLDEDHEVAYWTKALGVSAEELRSAVRTAGPNAEAVRGHLSRKS